MVDQTIETRLARDADGEHIIAIVAGCFAEYQGCVIDPERELPVFLRPKSAYQRRPGGRFWVAVEAEIVVGCVGIVTAEDPAGVELQKLYVSVERRRRGIGRTLCELVEAEARRRQAPFIELWSDTRFDQAHRLYQRLGYLRGLATRELHDASNSVEVYYRKPCSADVQY